MENDGSRPDHRVMRAGEAEYAMAASGMTRIRRRQRRRASRVVEAEFDAGHAVVGGSGQGEPAERNEQALRGHRVSENDADQWAQNACGAKPDNTEAHAVKLSLQREAYSTNDQSFGPSDS
jgi:hypothetical protein